MLPRRTLLRGALAAAPLAFLWRRRAAAAPYGDLVTDPAGLLDLPAGFAYRIVDRRGDRMSDGAAVPANPDGMACFAGPAGTLVLMRNHEIGAGGGGVSRVVLDATTLAVRSSNLVLTGTSRNCAGGTSPWGWLSCEEDVSPGHGYVFACSTSATRAEPGQRIDGYGRFNHEAAVADPVTQIAYLTEDRPDSCFYRFVPRNARHPWRGRLQALRVVGADRFDTGTGLAVGARLAIGWVDIADPTPADDSVRAQGAQRGAARFVRGEGLWLHAGAVFFSATAGGPVGGGQIFRLDPAGDGGTLTLIAQSEDRAILDMPDNLTVAPWGELFVCEDGVDGNLLRVIGEDGAVADFARNAASTGELAGACFSPDGQVLFVNLQLDGLTLAITGPFPGA